MYGFSKVGVGLPENGGVLWNGRTTLQYYNTWTIVHADLHGFSDSVNVRGIV